MTPVWDDQDGCRNVGEIKKVSLNKCKTTCMERTDCNAINYKKESVKECIFRDCPVNQQTDGRMHIPEPKYTGQKGFEGFCVALPPTDIPAGDS